MNRILIVDDEPRTREGIRKTLEHWSVGRYQIDIADNGKEALERLEQWEYNLIVTDIRMPEISGLDLVERIYRRAHPPAVIIISGYAEFEYAQQALRYGAVDYLLKPLDKNKLVQAVEKAFEHEQRNQRMERMEKLVDTKLLELAQKNRVYSVQVQAAISFVEENLHEQISLRKLAEELHMNASYFSVHFKEQTGMTFTDYVMRRKVMRAKELLTGTRYTIEEVANQVGYQTAKYFVKVFREMVGISPGRYRQQSLDHEIST